MASANKHHCLQCCNEVIVNSDLESIKVSAMNSVILFMMSVLIMNYSSIYTYL